MTVGSPGDKARQFKAALRDAAVACTRDLIDPDHPLLVRYGQPTRKQLTACDELILVTGVAVRQTEGPISRTNRARDLTLTATVVISVFRRGSDDDADDDLEEIATDRGYVLLDALEEYCRVTDTTLGDVVRHCFCTEHELEPEWHPELLKKGRGVEINATFTAQARVTN